MAEAPEGSRASLAGGPSTQDSAILRSNTNALLEDGAPPPTVKRWPEWWVALAWAGATAVGYACLGIANELAGPRPSVFLFYIGTTVTAIGHWLLIRRYLWRAFWWPLSEFFGSVGITALFTILLVSAMLLGGQEAASGIADWYATPPMTGILGGALLGGLQWLYLVWRVRDAWTWIVVSVVVLAVGPGEWLQRPLSEALRAFASSDEAIWLASATFWTALDLPRGAALVWLLRRPRVAPDSRPSI